MVEMSIGEFARRSRLSAKALRLYDGLDLLSPARVDDQSGYRYYESEQLELAQLISTLRQIGMPLTVVKELVGLDPADLADRVSAFWTDADAHHASQRELVVALVDRLTGRNALMYEVETREIPQRSILCLKRNVNEAEAWALGKEFIGILRDERMPRPEGRENATYSIFWGQVSADSDGPVEWCKPVPDDQAESLAEQFPELTLRVEPAHQEAYVDLGPAGPEGTDPARFAIADQALRAWAVAQGFDRREFSVRPEDLGLRITYLPSDVGQDTYQDFAIPFTGQPRG